jgi:MFS family permease
MAVPISSQQRSSSFLHSLHPLRKRNFGVFWTGAFLSSIGFWVQNVGQGWQVLQLTNSPLLLGLVTLAATLPNIVLSLIGGVISDRMDRRFLLISTQAIYMTTAALLGILTTLHLITVWLIVLLALVNGTFSSVGFPAWQTFIGDLVPPEELKQGIALNSMQFNLSRVIGPAIGGLSVGLVGIAGSYYLNAISYVAIIIPLLFIRPQIYQRASQSQEQQPGLLSGLRDGMRYVQARPLLQVLLLLQFMIAFFVFPYATLLPVFAGDIFRIGATGLGILNAAAGIGALLGSIVVVLLSEGLEGESSRRMLMLVCAVGGSASILFTMVANLSLALPLLVITGACAVMSMTVTNTALQSQTPQEMRGRVLSIWIMITNGIAPFGNLVAGWVAQQVGAPTTLAVGGAICATSGLLIAAVYSRATFAVMWTYPKRVYLKVRS